MPNIGLYVESYPGESVGWIEEFPLAFCFGNQPATVVNHFSHCLQDYLLRLQRGGEPVPETYRHTSTADLQAEIKAVYTRQPALSALPFDNRPLTYAERYCLLRTLRLARTDLIEGFRSLEPFQWDMAPLGEQSVRVLLSNQMLNEQRILAKLGCEVELKPHPDPIVTLHCLRNTFEETVLAFHEPEEGSLFVTSEGEFSLAMAIRLVYYFEKRNVMRIRNRLNPHAAFVATDQEPLSYYPLTDEPVAAPKERNPFSVAVVAHATPTDLYF